VAKKQITIGSRPSSAPPPAPVDAEKWVTDRVLHPAPEEEKIKRLTIDIPAGLHSRIKTQAASRGNKIVDELRELLDEKYPKP